MLSKNSSATAWMLMIVLALIWGSSFILMKRGLEVYTPFQIGALRMTISFLCLLPFLVSALRTIPLSKWKYLAAAGWLGNGIPSVLFPLAETHLDSALTGMLNSLTPMFAFLIGISFYRVTVTRNKIIGLLVGLIGACFLVVGKNSGEESGNLAYSGIVVLATVCYGTSVNIIRSRLSEVDPVSNTAMVLMFNGVPMCIALFTTDFTARTMATEGAAVSLGYIAVLAVFGTAFSTVLFNKLIKVSDALFASSVTYLIPVVAIGWGLLDSEHLSPFHLLGLAGALLGVYLINRSAVGRKD